MSHSWVDTTRSKDVRDAFKCSRTLAIYRFAASWRRTYLLAHLLIVSPRVMPPRRLENMHKRKSTSRRWAQPHQNDDIPHRVRVYSTFASLVDSFGLVEALLVEGTLGGFNAAS